MYLIIFADGSFVKTSSVEQSIYECVESGDCDLIDMKNELFYNSIKWEKIDDIRDVKCE